MKDGIGVFLKSRYLTGIKVKLVLSFRFHLSKKNIDLIQKILLFLVICERIRSHSSPSNRPRVIIGSINLDTDFGTSSFQFPPSRILLLTSVAENFGLS